MSSDRPPLQVEHKLAGVDVAYSLLNPRIRVAGRRA